MAINTLDLQLQRISERIAHLQNQPTALTRDLLLQALRQCYDEALQIPLAVEPVELPTQKKPEAAVPVVNEPESQVAEVSEHIAAPVAAKATASVDEVIPEAGTPFPEAVEDAAAPLPLAMHASAQKSHTDVKAERPNDDTILAGKLNRKPIADLQSGIPLNEKFGIIRNLFAGNASDFGDAVLKLNNSRSPEELKHYFQLLTQRRGWDMEQESYQVFLDYVDRKASALAMSDTHTDH